jgi:6-phosphogluconolactonase
MAPRIESHDTADELAGAMATALLERLAAAQSEGAVPQIALTGGTIADKLHRRLADLSPGSGVDWSRVVVWWGDERFVAPDSPDRNAGQAREAHVDELVSAGALPADHVHAMPPLGAAATPEESAAA